MQTKLYSLLALTALLGASCKDSATTSSPTSVPTSSPDPAGASQASITVGIQDATVAAAPGGGSNFIYTLTMVESAGVGANIDFVRLDIFRADGAFEERAEIGSGVIVAGVGDNRLSGNSSEAATVNMFFRATIKTGRVMLLTVGFTDDNGNNLQATFPFTFT